MEERFHTCTEDNSLTDTIIDNICAELSNRNWSLKMLADKADLPYESVKKLVSHKIQKPSFISIWQIANALDCSIDRLAGHENPSSAILHQMSEDASEIYRLIEDMNNLSKNILR